MEIFTNIDRLAFGNFIISIKAELDLWQLVEIKILTKAPKDITSRKIADILYEKFFDAEGKVYICNPKEVLAIIKTGKSKPPQEIKTIVLSSLPPGSCDVKSEKITTTLLTRIDLSIEESTLTDTISLQQKNERIQRNQNIILIADDDFYVRTLVKKGFENLSNVVEAVNGSEALTQYKKYIPDILFLDIHMPSMTGKDLLTEIYNFDNHAFIIMLSADMLDDRVKKLYKNGVKGFIAKPFLKSKLISFLEKCTTITLPKVQ